MYHIFFIHSSVDRHLGCFHVLAIVNSSAMNTGAHVSFWTIFFSRYMLRSGISGSYGLVSKFINTTHGLISSKKTTQFKKKMFRCLIHFEFIFVYGVRKCSSFILLLGCMRQVLGPGALGRPRGIGWRGRWEGGSGWGIHVYPWLIHVSV